MKIVALHSILGLTSNEVPPEKLRPFLDPLFELALALILPAFGLLWPTLTTFELVLPLRALSFVHART